MSDTPRPGAVPPIKNLGGPCPVCGSEYCVGFDSTRPSHLGAEARAEQERRMATVDTVIVDQDIYTAPDGFGRAKLIAAAGDRVPLSLVEHLGYSRPDVVTMVVAPRPIYSEPDAEGKAQQIVGAGDVLSLEEARRHGLDLSACEVVTRTRERRGPGRGVNGRFVKADA